MIFRRTRLVYGLLLAAWGLVVAWQVVEHRRVRQAARAALLNRPQAIGKTLGKVIQSLGLDSRSQGRLVDQERLEAVLRSLVTEGELSSIALLNAAGGVVVSAGPPIDFDKIGRIQSVEHWDADSVTFVRRVDVGESERPAGEAHRPTIVLPPPPRREGSGPPREDGRERPREDGRDRSRDDGWERPREGPRPSESDPANSAAGAASASLAANPSNALAAAASSTNRDDRPRNPGEGRRRGRPFWFWMMSEEERKSMAEKRGLHGLVIDMSTEAYRRTCAQDLWMRWIIGCFASVSVVGLGLAWRTFESSSELQMRLIRASELNSHLKEMNLAAAGLAHETRNPLNIIRGLAQMVSKEQDASMEIRRKSRDIVDETDRVTAQLNEFINYSRPREVRRAAVPLGALIMEVARALNYDLEEKHIRLQVAEEQLVVEADEQLLRQALFNLLLNAVQAVEPNGEIQVVANKAGASEAVLEVRDNGPGVAPEHRDEIFKPYFTTHQKGTGLGLAVVQQIVLAHGWEIQCLANEPAGALFRITHLKLTAKP